MKWYWVGLIGVVFGFLMSWGLSALLGVLAKKQEERGMKLRQRRREQRQDTELNIGKRFANSFDFLSKPTFWQEDWRCSDGRYQVHVGRGHEPSFMWVTVDLCERPESHITIRFRELDLTLSFTSSNEDVPKAVQETGDLLKKYYLGEGVLT
jgi:hypothetical protein